ncbi:MAG: hypothetical protein JSW58_08355 [Candidatus Latescibacterota bacterium]|nr:MAG: hypothetical protein JSW58_08355 [Candidatus Latescibacterota bacterium]
MTQAILNSSDNINQPHNVSLWFQQDWTGEYYDLGDLLVDGVSLSPEFSEFYSYRNGIRALRKRFLTNRAATVSATLNEPNIRNLQRVLFGGAVSSGQSATALEGKHLEIQGSAGSLYIDLTDAGESDFSNIVIKGLYDPTDVLEATNLTAVDLYPDTDGQVVIDDTDVALASGATIFVRYEVSVSSLYSSQIFGATETTIEGAAKLQARNLQGGVFQLWDLASVNLAPNGDLIYPIDAVQTVPVVLTLQERAGSFGTVYTK